MARNLPIGKAMERAGIRQKGSPILRQPARRLTLPNDAKIARDLLDEMREYLSRVGKLHDFTKGTGIAAPQINVSLSVALVRTKGSQYIELVNPRIVGVSDLHDMQYEGCLSFFDMRGMVPRPRQIRVEHYAVDGNRVTSTFTDGAARLVMHEIDHLYGWLYTARMYPGWPLIDTRINRYEGKPWRYDESVNHWTEIPGE